MKQKKKPKQKPKQYPLDEYIDQIWYDDWEKKKKAIPHPKHYWKVGGSI